MSRSADTSLVGLRPSGLLVEHLEDEALVYDTRTDTAHHLTPLAAAVLESSEGEATLAAAASLASERLGRPVTTTEAAAAAAQLTDTGLLEARGVPRREVLRRAALVG